jgi:hypothetical protein
MLTSPSCPLTLRGRLSLILVLPAIGPSGTALERENAFVRLNQALWGNPCRLESNQHFQRTPLRAPPHRGLLRYTGFGLSLGRPSVRSGIPLRSVPSGDRVAARPSTQNWQHCGNVHRGFVRENADHIGAALHLFIQPLLAQAHGGPLSPSAMAEWAWGLVTGRGTAEASGEAGQVQAIAGA